MKRYIFTFMASVMSISLLLANVLPVSANDTEKIDEKTILIQERLKERQEHLDGIIDWKSLLPTLENNIEETLGYVPANFGEPSVLDSILVLEDNEVKPYNNASCTLEMYTDADFVVMAVGCEGSLDTNWTGYDPWNADRITLCAVFNLISYGVWWFKTGDDTDWFMDEDSTSCTYATSVDDDWHIWYDYTGLGTSMTLAGYLSESAHAIYHFGEDEIEVDCLDTVLGSW